MMNRKHFLKHAAFSSGMLIASPLFLYSQSKKITDPLPAEKVKEFVIAGHGKFDELKKLLVEFPTLLYATWDWGNGDFETALEGAGHVGNKQIAEYLIDQGARTNMFVLTMLGKTAIVKNYLETFPHYLKARGPHGFSFLHHAEKGGEGASELVEYFKSKGLTETKLAL